MSDNCVLETLNETLRYFNRSFDNVVLNTAPAFVRHCILHGLRCSVFHPFPWLSFVKWHGLFQIMKTRNQFTKHVFSNSGVLVHHATANQLYGIHDIWTHFVCEHIKEGVSVKKFDGYKDQVAIDYGEDVNCDVNYELLFQKTHLMIFVQEGTK